MISLLFCGVEKPIFANIFEEKRKSIDREIYISMEYRYNTFH